MAKIGKTDAFERIYMQKFRAFTAKFGEFVIYERDRGVRDIGMHLTKKLRSGDEQLSGALVWFQMKGIMSSTMTKAQFRKVDLVAISLDVGHLRYWYLQPISTYLVVYIESVEIFLVLNVTEFVESTWGREILRLDQKTATVKIEKESVLDDQAFRLILQKNDIAQWGKALGTDNEQIGVCYRDYNLIWSMGTAKDRGVTHNLEFWDWQSKTRGQLYIKEVDNDNNQLILREHFQYFMTVEGLQDAYPYFEFNTLEEDDSWDDQELEAPPVDSAERTYCIRTRRCRGVLRI